jgi:hypothetical protein
MYEYLFKNKFMKSIFDSNDDESLTQMGNYNSSQPIHVSRPEVIEQHANMNLLKQFKFYNAAGKLIIPKNCAKMLFQY